MNWPEQIRIRNAIIRGEEQAAREHPHVDERDAVATMVRERQQRWEAEQRRIETERVERERRETEAHRARLQHDLEARQSLQNAWAQTREELRRSVAELRNAVAAAENKSNSADDAEAAAGVVDLAVAERRLARAESAYAMHVQRQP